MDDSISRQAAIDAFYLQSDDDGWWCGTAEDMEKLLKGLSPTQPEPDEWCKDCKEYDQEKHCCPRFNRVIRNALKDAQPEPKRGKWIVHPEVKNVYGGTYIECPQCGEKYVVQHMEDEKYCRNCGAKMEREQKHQGNKSDLVILDEVTFNFKRGDEDEAN